MEDHPDLIYVSEIQTKTVVFLKMTLSGVTGMKKNPSLCYTNSTLHSISNFKFTLPLKSIDGSSMFS